MEKIIVTPNRQPSNKQVNRPRTNNVNGHNASRAPQPTIRPLPKIPKSLRYWFMAHAVIDWLVALPLIVSPTALLSMLGWSTIDPFAARLVGAALIGIGGESWLGRHKNAVAYQSMLRLKVLWSGAAVAGLALTLGTLNTSAELIPWGAWLILATFGLFFMVWTYFAAKLECFKPKGRVNSFSLLLATGVFGVANTADASVLSKTVSDLPLTIEAEGQMLWQGRNDAAIPGNTGSRFSLRDAISSPKVGYRIEPTYRFSERHELRGVFAPLSISGSGKLTNNTRFNQTTFNNTDAIEATFKFNSYRLTYRYSIFTQSNSADSPWFLALGGTVKVRDAKISVKQGNAFEQKSNVGFVPLLHAAVGYRLAEDWQIELELDALAAPQGRAEDVRLGIRKSFLDNKLSVLAGYRILEGGADNDGVYTFAFIHYATLSVAYSF